MNTVILIIILILVIASLLISLFRKPVQFDTEGVEKLIKDEFQRNREETDDRARKDREELTNSLNSFDTSLKNSFKEFTKQQEGIGTAVENKLESIRTNNDKQLDKMRKTVETSLDTFGTSLENKFKEFTKQQEGIGKAVENKLESIRTNNDKQLDKMRETVDEKLQKTLNERLTASFANVSDNLERVQTGLGEMTTLAKDVGSLQRVLTNVRQRGTLGETQLGMLLGQILSSQQYQANVNIQGGNFVEFAIKLPGRDADNSTIWLPIDAKFPVANYEQLLDAYEKNDGTDSAKKEVDKAKKEMEKTVKNMAKDINERYINPPKTTDFAIMFLPFEGLYAEVIRNVGLFEKLQHQYKVTVAGPTTLAALLNSLQMGFKTLAIEKRSSEVWKILGAVKTEFGNFSDMMSRAQKNIQTGLNQLDEVQGKRTRAIERKLNSVEALDEEETKKSSHQPNYPLNN